MSEELEFSGVRGTHYVAALLRSFALLVDHLDREEHLDGIDFSDEIHDAALPDVSPGGAREIFLAQAHLAEMIKVRIRKRREAEVMVFLAASDML